VGNVPSGLHQCRRLCWRGDYCNWIGFVLPTLYFLEPDTFNGWLASPWYFCSIIVALCILPRFGVIAWSWWAPVLIDQQKLPFPVSQLTHQIITSHAQTEQSRRMLFGMFGTTVICALRDGIGSLGAVISKTYYVFPSILHHEIGFMIMPAYWAIGFSVGLAFTVPLAIGMIAKYLVLYPLAHHAHYLPFQLFQVPSMDSLSVAFCSGLILCELVLGLSGYARQAFSWLLKNLMGAKKVFLRQCQFFLLLFSVILKISCVVAYVSSARTGEWVDSGEHCWSAFFL